MGKISFTSMSNPFELTPNLVYTVVGVLKAADYRSAANYLEAAKRRHVQAGHPWTDQLRQACKMAIRSAKRDLGPSKQAEPIQLAVMASLRVREASDVEGPLAPGRACLLASWWFLREIEASHAKMSHVRVDWSKKQVDLQLPNSKTDQLALGTSRSHTLVAVWQRTSFYAHFMQWRHNLPLQPQRREIQASGYSPHLRETSHQKEDGQAHSWQLLSVPDSTLAGTTVHPNSPVIQHELQGPATWQQQALTYGGYKFLAVGHLLPSCDMCEALL